MANNENIFSRLTTLFRSGPVVKRRVKEYAPGTKSTSAYEQFKKTQSNVYSTAMSAYGAYDRMARYCLAGDTNIAVNHPDSCKTIKNIVEDFENGTLDYGVFSIKDKNIVFGEIERAWCTGEKEIWEVTLDDGNIIRCSNNHPFMLRNGEYKRADELIVSDALMPFRRSKTKNGYLFNISKRGLAYEHSLVQEHYEGSLFKKSDGRHIHHKNFIQEDNRKNNLLTMNDKEHLALHARINNRRFDIQENRDKQSTIMSSRWSEGGDLRINLENATKKSKTTEGYKKRIKRTINRNKVNPPGTGNKGRKDQKGIWNARCKRETVLQTIYSSYISGMSFDQLAEKLNSPTQNHLLTRLSWGGFSSWNNFIENYTNHKVVSTRKTGQFELVYDLTIKDHHNFALTDKIGQGIVFVHNSDFQEMEYTPEISSALDIYAEESISPDENDNVIHVFSDNPLIQKILNELFFDTLNVNFNLSSWVRNMVKYGDFFLFNDVSPDHGVINVYPIPVNEMEREEAFDKNDPTAVRYRWVTQGNQVLQNWQVSHFRLLGNDAFLPYGTSVIEAARRIWRQLILIEDAMLVYRVVRSPDRRVFYIDVGNVPPEEIPNYMEQVQSSLKKSQVIDRSTGRVDLRYNPLSVDEDYFLPVRGGASGTKIDNLPGGSNATAIEDVIYIQKKLFAALKIPKAYLGYDEGLGAKATLSQEDVRFSRTINRIQRTIISELNKLAIIHLYSNGYDGHDLLDFTLKLTNPSTIALQQKLELYSTKFTIANTAQSVTGMVDKQWIRKRIFSMTDDEILKIEKGLLRDKEMELKIESVKLQDAEAETPPAEAPAGGPPPGGGEVDSPLGTLDFGGEKSAEPATGEEQLGEDDFSPSKIMKHLKGFPVNPQSATRHSIGKHLLDEKTGLGPNFAQRDLHNRKRRKSTRSGITPDHSAMVGIDKDDPRDSIAHPFGDKKDLINPLKNAHKVKIDEDDDFVGNFVERNIISTESKMSEIDSIIRSLKPTSSVPSNATEENINDNDE